MALRVGLAVLALPRVGVLVSPVSRHEAMEAMMQAPHGAEAERIAMVAELAETLAALLHLEAVLREIAATTWDDRTKREALEALAQVAR